jgi:acylphosphatase
MQVVFRVHGNVQGVGFRRFAAWEAQRLGLAGWVRNAPDDTVCGEAEGVEDALATFRARLTLGPTFAAVSRLDWGEADMRSSLPRPFEIRR